MQSTIRSSLIIVATLAGLSAMPAMASSAYHPQNGEAGASFHPNHVTSSSRNQVESELAAAMKNPAWQPLVSRGAPWPDAKSGTPKSRAEVRAELNAAMKSPAWSLVSRGAPWPSNGMTVNQMTPK